MMDGALHGRDLIAPFSSPKYRGEGNARIPKTEGIPALPPALPVSPLEEWHIFPDREYIFPSTHSR